MTTRPSNKYRRDGSMRPTEVRYKIRDLQACLSRLNHDLSRIDTDSLIAVWKLLHNIEWRQQGRIGWRETHTDTDSESEHT